MSLEPLFTLDVENINDLFLYRFVATGKEFTNIGALLFITEMENTMKTFSNKNIKKVALLFHLETFSMPTNHALVQKYSEVFIKNQEILRDKLQFTIIQTNNNIFDMFFTVFKLFYIPIKPLYLCKNDSETNQCICNHGQKDNLIKL